MLITMDMQQHIPTLPLKLEHTSHMFQACYICNRRDSGNAWGALEARLGSPEGEDSDRSGGEAIGEAGSGVWRTAVARLLFMNTARGGRSGRGTYRGARRNKAVPTVYGLNQNDADQRVFGPEQSRGYCSCNCTGKRKKRRV